MFFPFPLLFLVFYLFIFWVLRMGTKPFLYAVAGGVAAHMALVAGHNASGLPKALAVAWPVNLLPFFAYATAVTSAAWLAVIWAGRWGGPGDALSVALSLYNFPFFLSLTTAYYSLPQYSPLASYVFLSGVAALAAVEVYLLRTVSALFRDKPLLWSLPAFSAPAGYAAYFVLPHMAVDIYPRLVSAVFFAAAAALLVYVMFRNNVAVAGLLGGIQSYRFWVGLFAGVMLYAVPEVLLMLYHPDVHTYLHT
jgi:hypothetical protein